MFRVACACLLLSLSTGVAQAQTSAILGQENDVFARALFQEGYLDLAEGVCAAIEKGYADGKGDANEVSEVKAIRFELRLGAAKRENDMGKRKELIQSVLQDANAFINENSRTKVASTVRDNLPDAYLELGETLTAILDREQDPQQIASIRQEGQTSFAQAVLG